MCLCSFQKLWFCSSDADQDFMIKHVLAYLEEELGFSVCIHERDFIPGRRIWKNIQNAIEKSRRTIALISRWVLTGLVVLFYFSFSKCVVQLSWLFQSSCLSAREVPFARTLVEPSPLF